MKTRKPRQPWFLKSVTLHGVDLPKRPFRFASGDEIDGLEFTLALDPTGLGRTRSTCAPESR